MVAGFAGELALGCERGRLGNLNSSYTSQAQIQGFELANPNIYSIDELLEYTQGQSYQIQNHSISMTQGNNRIWERYPRKVPVLIEEQKTEASYQTIESL